MKKLKQQNAITLVALVVTIIILIILAAISISALTRQGLFEKTQLAVEETLKQTATEKMNFKITEVEMASWTEKQRMPTLQELADELCKNEDDEFEYVLTNSKKIGSKLENIVVTDSIFTKFKEYPFEFEINSNLQLASIDGIKIESNKSNVSSENANIKIYIDGVEVDDFPPKESGYRIDSVSCTDGATATFDKTNWKLNINNIATSKTVCTVNFTASTLLNELIKNIDNDSELNKIFSNEETFSEFANDEDCMAYICESSKLRNLMYDNYSITESILANSTIAISAMKNSSRYDSITKDNFLRGSDTVYAVSDVIYDEKIFLIQVDVANNVGAYIGNFLSNPTVYKIANSGSSTDTFIVTSQWNPNKFMSSLMGGKPNTSYNNTLKYYYFKI